MKNGKACCFRGTLCKELKKSDCLKAGGKVIKSCSNRWENAPESQKPECCVRKTTG